jgi:hypothetical protein
MTTVNPSANHEAKKSKRFQPNPLSKKYGHHAHQDKQKSSTSVNLLKQQLRSIVRMIAKFPDREDLKTSKKAIEQRILLGISAQKEQVLQEKYKYLKFVGKLNY